MANNFQVKRFNAVCGRAPQGFEGTTEEVWEQIQTQAKFILEEAQEQYNAAMARDIVEVLDGYCDVDYLQEQQKNYLNALHIQTKKALGDVADNNDLKFSQAVEVAVKTADYHQEQGTPCFVHMEDYEGGKYFVAKRCSDGKVMKPEGFEGPNMRQHIPFYTLQFLNGEDMNVAG